jgi:hypothetical protein
MAGKKLRFAELVKSSGRPHVATLWGDPKKDGGFMKAVRENRVLTVNQEPTAKTKDFGTIGFHEEKSAAYFIFPQPLPESQEGHVIGIKYDLLDEGRVAGSVRSVKVKKECQKEKPPQRTKFSVTVRRIATIESALTIEARTADEAKTRALKEIQSQPFDPTESVVRNEIRAVSKA